MLNIICKSFPHFKSPATNSIIPRLNFIQIHPLSTLNSTSKSPDEQQKPSFTLSYLINTCGLSQNEALGASKYINFDNPEIPDSILEFFKHHGFTRTQALTVIKRRPKILLQSNPEKTLLPKLQFLTSKGISSSDVAKLVSGSPSILGRSLKNHIIPTFDHLKNTLNSEEKALRCIKRFPSLLLYDPHTYLTPSIEILREIGVPESNIVFLLSKQPRTFRTNPTLFKEAAEEVKKMGFNPKRVKFVIAVHALRSMSKITWAKKLVAYKKWGWSENDVMVAFGRYPWCITASEDKIDKTMDFIVNKIGWNYSVVVGWPLIMSLSLENRIIPRCLVYQFLLSKGLIKNEISVSLLLKTSESCFVDRFVKPFEEKAPELLKIYEAK